MTDAPPNVMDIIAWLRTTTGGQARDLQLDSRRLGTGDVFVAIPGQQADGRAYLDTAAQLGASAALVEAAGWPALRGGRPLALPVLAVPGLAALLGPLAARWYGQPSQTLQVVGVTGTNGKTSCSQWVAQLLTVLGRRCAVIGTVGSGFPGATFGGASLTTPDAIGLQREVARLRAEGAQALAMEVSSIGLDQGRVNGMTFDTALFTNLTRDHLDYHGTMARYEAAKARLFDWPTLTHAVLNLDDAAGQRLAARLASRAAAGLRVIGYGLTAVDTPCPLAHRLRAEQVRATAQGLAFDLVLDGRERHALEVPLVGQFNASNLLGVLGCVLAAGHDLRAALARLPELVPPPGRMQRVGGRDEPLAVIDYAHTPDALAQALAALRPLAQARSGALWVVFGAGGDRDPGKRAPMGEAAARGADRLVITSDNPRREDPLAIIAAIARGVPAGRDMQQQPDRARAIADTLRAAATADVVLIAGKGHEDYQDTGGRKTPFSDVTHAEAALAARKNGHAGGSASAAHPQAVERAPC
jgi:UDP-N-acetylmuramoyl-L-alanyl-D-glutamate--2,6-diaminopimelate ligase